VQPSWSEGRTAGHFFGREPPNYYFIKILFLLSKRFQTRRFLLEFSIGPYVKLSSAVAAILVGGLKYRTQFWKVTTQESFQQNLVETVSVVSSPLFSIFSLVAILVGSRDHRIQFSRGLPKDHFTKVWLQLPQWFPRRRLKCEMLTDGRRTKSDGNRSHGLKAR
jgi:hypothetical protein